MRKLKLELELVPATSFNMNLRNNFSSEDWDIIRRLVYKRAGHRCEICDTTGRMSAHEIWDYVESDSGNFVTLAGLICLCDDCHMCKHWGYAQMQADVGKLDMVSLEKHFMKVNSCRKTTLEKHKAISFAEWNRRSSLEWQLNIDYLGSFLDEELDKRGIS
ncbi:hypothetical protein ABGV42_00320 [Paenibacillus pabuli]|uniref:HNH endonuclease n=1 Tax=Paenibacillus pabuli TaxID=1472 RepID=UPI003242AD7D